MSSARVLVVEDERVSARDIQATLQGFGYEVPAIAGTVEEAMSCAERLRPDLILMDIRLAGARDGISAAQEIRRRFDIPIIYLTAYADPETVERATRTEAYGYLLKPYSEQELHTTVQLALYKSKAERVVKESEERFRKLVENASDMITVLNAEGIITYKGPSVRRVLGYRAEELLGKPLQEVVHPDDRGIAMNSFLECVMSSSECYPIEYRMLHKDGSWRVMEARGTNNLDDPAVGGVVLNSRDITERKQAEEAVARANAELEQRIRERTSELEAALAEVREHERRLDAVVSAAPIAVITIGRDKRVTGWNAAAERIFGYTAAEVLGQSFPIFAPELDRACMELLDKEFAGEPIVGLEQSGLRRDGSMADVRVSVAPLVDERGRTTGVVKLVEDIAEEKRRQQRVRESDRLATLGYMAAGVAHEVNNPLAAISNFAELLLMESPPDEMLDDISSILAESKRAGTIVRNLLAFARKSVPEKISTDLGSVIESVVNLKSHQLRTANIRVEFDLNPSTPPVLVDPHQIQQVLHNLLSNARQAIQHSYDEGTIRIRLRAAGGMAEVILEDTGPGISSEVLPKIFTPFFTTKPVGEGTGMGLPIVDRIVQDHAGEILTENWGRPPVVGGQRGEGGAKIVLRLPLAIAPPAQKQIVDRHSPEPTTTRVRCLIIEDEPLLARSVQKFLKRIGMKGDISLRAEDAVERLLQGERFDVILSDLSMPGLGGRGLYHRLRQERPESLSALIFTSGDISTEETHQFLEMSGRPVLPKPYDLKELEEVITNVLEDSRK